MHWVGSRDSDQPYLKLTKSQSSCLLKEYHWPFSCNIDNHIDIPIY